MFTRFNMLEQLVVIQDKRVLISYKGPVTPIIMAEISRDIQDKLSDNSKASRKVFAVFLELAQNILFYSAEKVQYAGRNDSVGMLHVVEMEDQFSVICGNTVSKSDMIELTRSCEAINLLDKEGLRELKRNQRKQPPSRKSKGAGIGMVQVAILSDNPLEIHEHAVDQEHSFFTLSVTINK